VCESGPILLPFGKLGAPRCILSSDRAISPLGKKKNTFRKIQEPEKEIKSGLSLNNYFSILGKVMHFVKKVKQNLAYKNIHNLSEQQFKIISDYAYAFSDLVFF
jgi:hypothetical protein